MSDDLDDLKALMQAATPDPDAERKAANLALARKNFDAAQETRGETRQTSDRPEKPGLFRGVKTMFANLSARSLMTASTALVAIGLVAVIPDWQAPLPGLSTANEEAEIVVAPERPKTTEPAADMAAPEVLPAPMPMMEAAPANGARSRVAPSGAEPILLPPGTYMEGNTEAFPEAEANPLKVTVEEPVSTFSIDVDTASYAILRSSLTAGQLPPEGAVRIEEMVNYFPYDYPAPQAGEAPFEPTLSVTPTPWNPDTQLLHIAIQGAQPAIEDRPPLNLVFLIDTSGSMAQPDKLPLLKQAFALMLPQLSAQDEVAIVTYAGSAGEVLSATPGSDRATILAALDRLDAGGSTAGQAGLQQAYGVAEAMADDGEVTRVILATDGDFNVGLSDPDALKTTSPPSAKAALTYRSWGSGAAISMTRPCRRWRRTATGRRPISTRWPRRRRCWWTSSPARSSRLRMM
jgi:Ca-activated chloride channel family protein